MKHSLRITLMLVSLFLITQVFGLVTIAQNLDISESESGEIVVEPLETVVGEPPKAASGLQSILVIALAVIVGTIILLIFIKYRIKKLWKYWYLFAVITTVSVTLGVYITWFAPLVNTLLVIGLGIGIGWLKLYRPHIITHNVSEVLIYTGIAVLFVSLFQGWLWAVFVLLILISLYDMFAVWQSKHMIKLAEYQTESNIFAGLSIPYNFKAGSVKLSKSGSKKTSKHRVAVLGGGDLAFPLLFSGSVLLWLLEAKRASVTSAVMLSSIIAVAAAAALLYLFIKAEKNKFYPAMPYVTAGCFAGFAVVWVLV